MITQTRRAQSLGVMVMILISDQNPQGTKLGGTGSWAFSALFGAFLSARRPLTRHFARPNMYVQRSGYTRLFISRKNAYSFWSSYSQPWDSVYAVRARRAGAYCRREQSTVPGQVVLFRRGDALKKLSNLKCSRHSGNGQLFNWSAMHNAAQC